MRHPSLGKGALCCAALLLAGVLPVATSLYLAVQRPGLRLRDQLEGRTGHATGALPVTPR